MPFIRPARLSRLQRRLERTLDGGACTIQRPSTTPTPIGGTSTTWPTVATVPKHSVSPIGDSAGERVIADRITAYQTVTISLPVGTDVRQGDRIVSGGRTWEVAGIISGHTNAMLMRVVASRDAA